MACTACLAPCTPPTASNHATGWATCVAYREPGTHEPDRRRPNLPLAESSAPWRPWRPHLRSIDRRQETAEPAEATQMHELEGGLSKYW